MNLRTSQIKTYADLYGSAYTVQDYDLIQYWCTVVVNAWLKLSLVLWVHVDGDVLETCQTCAEYM